MELIEIFSETLKRIQRVKPRKKNLAGSHTNSESETLWASTRKKRLIRLPKRDLSSHESRKSNSSKSKKEFYSGTYDESTRVHSVRKCNSSSTYTFIHSGSKRNSSARLGTDINLENGHFHLNTSATRFRKCNLSLNGISTLCARAAQSGWSDDIKVHLQVHYLGIYSPPSSTNFISHTLSSSSTSSQIPEIQCSARRRRKTSSRIRQDSERVRKCAQTEMRFYGSRCALQQ